MKLREMQDTFQSNILDASRLERDEGFRDILTSDHGTALENRMSVYRNNIMRSLIDAALAPLPLCKKLVGEPFLEMAMKIYVPLNLPKEGNLNLYGASFPDFLARYKPAEDLLYLPDLARLEWAWERAYYAPDDAALSIDALGDIEDDKMPDLRFKFRSSFSMIESKWPLDKIVDFCRTDNPPEKFDASPADTKIMIFRPENTVEMRKLADDEHLLLKGLQKNVKLGQVAETILRSHPNFDLGELLQKHFVLETFAGFEI